MLHTTLTMTFKIGWSTEEKKWKGNCVSELINRRTRISSFTTADAYGNTGCDDVEHKSLQGLKRKYIYETIYGVDYIKR